MVETGLSLFPWQLFDQRVDNSLNRAADVGSPYLKKLGRLATTYRIPLAYSHTVFQYAINDEELRKRRVDCTDFFIRSVFSKIEDTFAWNQQFKVGSFGFGAHKLGKDFSHVL